MVILWLFVAQMSVPACRLIYCCAIERRSIWKSFSLLKGPQRCGLLHLIPYQSTCKRTWLILIRTPSFSCILELFGENCKVVLCWHTIPAFWLVDWWRSTTPWDYISKRQQRLRIQSQLWEPRKFEIQFFKNSYLKQLDAITCQGTAMKSELTPLDEFRGLLRYLRRTLFILVFKIKLRHLLCL